jgi:acetyl esterase/lipase
VIVWVHGGGWRFGGRRAAPDLARFFASRGFAMAAIEYRLTNRAIFPAQIEDLRTAIRWLRSTAGQYGLDGNRIGLWGASAGGHLSALAALAPDGLFDRDGMPYADQPAAVQAVVEGYGPIDFLQLDAHRPPDGTVSEDPENLRMPRGLRSVDARSFESMLLGAPIETCPERVQAANPLTYAHPGAPPFLIVHGLADTTIAPHQSELLYESLASRGNDVTLCLVPGLGHGFFNRTHLDDGRAWTLTLKRPGGTEQRVQPVFATVETFFRTHLA